MKRSMLGSGLVGFCALALAVGCSSSGGTVNGSGGSNGNGSGGNNGSGGSNNNGSGGSNNNGSGGSNNNGSGGSNNGSGGSNNGSGGSGDGSGGSGMTSDCMAVGSDAIASFDGSDSILASPYMGAEVTTESPMTEMKDGAFVMTFNTMMSTYAYVGLPFMACGDASAYTGVSFNISGMLSDGCTIQFSTVDREHNTVANKGTCMASSCYPSSMVFTLPSSATDVTVKFADQAGGGADTSAAVVDPKMITGAQWQINPDKTKGCMGTVTIDNVKFVK